jgi:hypothetical protein
MKLSKILKKNAAFPWKGQWTGDDDHQSYHEHDGFGIRGYVEYDSEKDNWFWCVEHESAGKLTTMNTMILLTGRGSKNWWHEKKHEETQSHNLVKDHIKALKEETRETGLEGKRKSLDEAKKAAENSYRSVCDFLSKYNVQKNITVE